MPGEPIVSPDDLLPPGYRFVPKGNVYITAHCRKATRAAGRTVYVVVGPGHATLGLRCPAAIWHAVRRAERETRAARAAATRRRDENLADTFREAVLTRFPAVPAVSLPSIVHHALAKHRGRVGRTSTQTLRQRATLVVRAFLRHRHTDYDKLLRSGVPQPEARRRTIKVVDMMARQWSKAC